MFDIGDVVRLNGHNVIMTIVDWGSAGRKKCGWFDALNRYQVAELPEKALEKVNKEEIDCVQIKDVVRFAD